MRTQVEAVRPLLSVRYATLQLYLIEGIFRAPDSGVFSKGPGGEAVAPIPKNLGGLGNRGRAPARCGARAPFLCCCHSSAAGQMQQGCASRRQVSAISSGDLIERRPRFCWRKAHVIVRRRGGNMTDARRAHERSVRQALYEEDWPRSVPLYAPPPLIGAFSFLFNSLRFQFPPFQFPPCSSRRAITCAWISAAPSKIERMRASHRIREIRYSSANPLPP